MKSQIFRKLDCQDLTGWPLRAGLFRRTILSWNMATLELSAIILGMARWLCGYCASGALWHCNRYGATA